MKHISIFSLVLLSIVLSDNSGSKSDIVIFGHNYTGDLKDGKRDGNGKYIYQNGDTYEGMWALDKKKEREPLLTTMIDILMWAHSLMIYLMDGVHFI